LGANVKNAKSKQKTEKKPDNNRLWNI